ncbi:thiol-activated cytolysin family protein [Archangium lansingense]|uniref:Thiol-activated cytolysin family protein n=1 Tax=Archangium lansingense TaxID=2995310 RepID=A0ABT4AAQ4_9BACT|nr:thiol-activated cytolysin family protein [Archangium lansinium]MCY1078753.1 thiol-activated cytolysin family protein [Archangium lansinium]
MSDLYARAQALGVPPSVAGVPNIETFLQSGYLGGGSVMSLYPTGATSVQDFINKLFQNGIWQNPSSGQTSTVLAPDALGCQLKQVDERYNPEELVSFDAGAGLLFPSALNQGRYVNLGLGALTPLHVPYPQRKPVKLVATFYQTATAPTATSTDVYNSIGQLIQAANAQGAITQSNTYFEMKSASSLEEAAAKFKLDAKILGGNISASFSSTTSTQSNTVFVRFSQSLFTIFQDLQGFTPALGEFNPANFLVSDLNKLGDAGELGYDNLPTYVRAVTYGRMLLFSVSSSTSKAELEAAVNAVYGPFSGSATAQQRKIIQNSQMRLFAYGGPSEPAIAVIKSGVWQDYFTLQNVPLASLKPIGYEVRRLDDQLATMSRTTRYTERVCPGERKIRVELSDVYKDAKLYVKKATSTTWQEIMSVSGSSSSGGYNSVEINSHLVGADDEIKVVSVVGQPGFLKSYQSRVKLKIFVDGVEKVNQYYSCTYCHSREPVWVYTVNKYTGDVVQKQL